MMVAISDARIDVDRLLHFMLEVNPFASIRPVLICRFARFMLIIESVSSFSLDRNLLQNNVCLLYNEQNDGMRPCFRMIDSWRNC